MSYRSDVCLCLNKKGKQLLQEKLDAYASETRKLVKELLSSPDRHHYDPKTDSEIWYWGDIKWYQDYEDVKFVENLLSELDEENYHFLRIGESIDDNEDYGYFHDMPFDVYISRYIKFDPPMEN